VTSPGYDLLPETTPPPNHCAVFTALLSRSLHGPSLSHARIAAGASRSNYDINKLGETGCRGNETSNMIKQEGVKGNSQFVLSVVAVTECTLKVITFVIEYCRVCVGMHTDQMCHKQGAMCRWQNTAINVTDRLLLAGKTQVQIGG